MFNEKKSGHADNRNPDLLHAKRAYLLIGIVGIVREIFVLIGIGNSIINTYVLPLNYTPLELKHLAIFTFQTVERLYIT